MSAELFVEILHEELPVSMTSVATRALRDGLLGLLEGIEHGEVHTWSTPRRTAVRVADVATESPRVDKLVTGPLVEHAFKDGVATKAAIGFARGKGLEVDALEQVEGPKGMVIAARVTEGGDPTLKRLSEGLFQVVLGIPFGKSMQWGTGGVRFGRPLHRVSALFGGEVIPAAHACVPTCETPDAYPVVQLATGNSTVGHRLAEDNEFSFSSADAWQKGLVERRVEPDVQVRRSLIQVLLDQATEELGADPIDEPALLDEVTQLVEWPTLVVGTFDEDLLKLPPKLLIEAMKVHQRYFPVHRKGELINHFVVISNNPWGDAELIAQGNARVLRARFYDARFFLAEDYKKSLVEHGKALHKMRWIRGLGTMAQKAERLGHLSRLVAGFVGADADEAARAGLLCKADLTSQMVGEFPSLQGHMGRLYALHDGEHEAVAWAIEHHYLPTSADDDAPESRCSAAVALADRLDTLVGCFGIGLVPKGGDPQGLRRAALGVVNILLAHGLDCSLEDLFGAAFDVFARDAAAHGAPAFDRWLQAAPVREELIAQLIAFTQARQKAAEVADGASSDLVDAVLSSTFATGVPLANHGRVAAVRELAAGEDFLPILHTFKRVLNISRGVEGEPPELDELTCEAEEALYFATQTVAARVSQALHQHDYELALSEMLSVREPVDRFFEAVLVDSEDPKERAARKGLLLGISRVFLQVADFSRITTR